MKNKQLIIKIVTLAILSAMIIVLQAFATNIKIGEYSPALALVPIAVGAILFGPIAGTSLGAIWSLYILIFDPSCGAFFAYSWIGTVVTVLGKGALAGLASGWAYKLIKRWKKTPAMIVAAIIVPLVNSVWFRIGLSTFFFNMLGSKGVSTQWLKLFTTWSFPLEFGISAVFSPVIVRICLIGEKTLGLSTDNGEELDSKKAINLEADNTSAYSALFSEENKTEEK